MTELIRDTVFGHLLRLLSGSKVLPFLEEKDPEYWKQYVHRGKTANVARHGHTEDDSDSEAHPAAGLTDKEAREKRGNSNESSPARVSNSDTLAEHSRLATNAVGMKVDPEKGKDVNVVTFVDDDPENPQNWSSPKKLFVTFEICLLTFSVYIGSAIFTAGIMDIEQVFGVSQVAVRFPPSLRA